MSIVTTDSTILGAVIRGKKPFVLLMGSETCAPCKVMKARLSAMADGMKGSALRFFYLPMEENLQFFKDYGVRSIPTTMAFKNGEAVGRLVGPHTSPDTAAFLNEALA